MTKVKITIDGHDLEVEQGTNLIEAARQLGKTIPHYCYHPGLPPDGNCRMCLVQVEKMPKPVIGCRTGATEGMVVHTQSDEVKKMRQSIMEFLLINHPLDCPTCDQAGECRLQDYYMDYDRIPSRYQEQKVHKDKMVDLGAGVMLDEERCIVCTRCVRVCQEVAKSEELFVQERGNHSMVATFPGKKMTNPYAGNTVDVCPVGALTSKDFRYKKRVWFLSAADSVCQGCSRGCNISVHHADNRVYRLKPRHNPEVNDYWMCDYGRIDYKFVNDGRRLKPHFKTDAGLQEDSYQNAFAHLQSVLQNYSADQITGIASAQESNEEINAFVDFIKSNFGSLPIYFSKNNPENPYEDDILIKADKNPNSAHIASKNLKPVSEISGGVKAVFVQRNLSAQDAQVLKDKGIQIVALFATNETNLDNLAEVILPIPTFAEQNGHFTNFEGKVQGFTKALKPRGESRLFAEHAEDIKALLSSIKKAS
ncbi:MAG: (2Fe-2S)-binding protein [Deltaproteobacteria bacterium]|nr:(2Fe-2S)-binding protein [Deltaproteobacteria bacterium]